MRKAKTKPYKIGDLLVECSELKVWSLREMYIRLNNDFKFENYLKAECIKFTRERRRKLKKFIPFAWNKSRVKEEL